MAVAASWTQIANMTESLLAARRGDKDSN